MRRDETWVGALKLRLPASTPSPYLTLPYVRHHPTMGIMAMLAGLVLAVAGFRWWWNGLVCNRNRSQASPIPIRFTISIAADIPPRPQGGAPPPRLDERAWNTFWCQK